MNFTLIRMTNYLFGNNLINYNLLARALLRAQTNLEGCRRHGVLVVVDGMHFTITITALEHGWTQNENTFTGPFLFMRDERRGRVDPMYFVVVLRAVLPLFLLIQIPSRVEDFKKKKIR